MAPNSFLVPAGQEQVHAGQEEVQAGQEQVQVELGQIQGILEQVQAGQEEVQAGPEEVDDPIPAGLAAAAGASAASYAGQTFAVAGPFGPALS